MIDTSTGSNMGDRIGLVRVIQRHPYSTTEWYLVSGRDAGGICTVETLPNFVGFDHVHICKLRFRVIIDRNGNYHVHIGKRSPRAVLVVSWKCDPRILRCTNRNLPN